MKKQAIAKQSGAFLTIGELASELGVPQHILRYWETRFPQLRPLQRAGNRRYYRPGDAALARRIHFLLGAQGFTIRGAQAALAGEGRGKKSPHIDTEQVVPGTAGGDAVLRLQQVYKKLEELLSA